MMALVNRRIRKNNQKINSVIQDLRSNRELYPDPAPQPDHPYLDTVGNMTDKRSPWQRPGFLWVCLLSLLFAIAVLYVGTNYSMGGTTVPAIPDTYEQLAKMWNDLVKRH